MKSTNKYFVSVHSKVVLLSFSPMRDKLRRESSIRYISGFRNKCGMTGESLGLPRPCGARNDTQNIFLRERLQFIFTIILACCSLFTASGNAAAQDPNAVAKGINAFAFNLYGKIKDLPEIKKAEGNLFFSPYSISSALAMTYTGARGNTAKEMASVLSLPSADIEQIAAGYGSLQKQLQADPKTSGYQLNIANALWGQKGYGFLPAFLDLNKKYFGSGLTELDFAQSEAARKTINTWVEEQTKEKIKELIAPDIIDGDVKLVLTNAIYFKGQWAAQFKTENTKPAKFNVTTDKTVDVPMMYQKGEFAYTENNDMQLLLLPYKGNELSMLVILPKNISSFDSVEKQVIQNKLPVDSVRKQEVEVYLPKFKITCGTLTLNDNLKDMGMKDAFNERKADFSGMNGRFGLFIAYVLHKAFVEVNEEGTEAAAATAVIMKEKALPRPVPVFRADRPFIFTIIDNRSQSILFMGRVMNPSLVQ
jgi:serpin B